MTNEEFEILPEYCHSKQWVSSNQKPRPGSQPWIEAFGSVSYPAIHHYCWALLDITRAYRSSTKTAERIGLLKNAKGDIGFTLQHTTADFVLRAELHTRLIEIAFMLNDERGAEKAFTDALRTNERYWQAYWWRAFMLNRSGRNAEARKILELGLSKVPEAAKLKQLADEIAKSAREKKQ